MGPGHLALLVLVLLCMVSNAGLYPVSTLVLGLNPKEGDGSVHTEAEQLDFMALGTGK